ESRRATQARRGQGQIHQERYYLLHYGPGRTSRHYSLQPESGLENMKDKGQKKEDLDALHRELAKAANIFLTGYEKLTVQQDFELRKAIRGAGATYKVIKNTLAEKAAEGTRSANLLKDLKGMCSIAYTSGDPVALAKALTTYAKANPSFSFRAGVVEGRAVDVSGINALSTLPS